IPDVRADSRPGIRWPRGYRAVDPDRRPCPLARRRRCPGPRGDRGVRRWERRTFRSAAREKMEVTTAVTPAPDQGPRARPPAGGGYSSCAEVAGRDDGARSEEHTSELQSRENLVCRLLLEKKKILTRRTEQERGTPRP